MSYKSGKIGFNGSKFGFQQLNQYLHFHCQSSVSITRLNYQVIYWIEYWFT
jgi:hypothetical protein